MMNALIVTLAALFTQPHAAPPFDPIVEIDYRFDRMFSETSRHYEITLYSFYGRQRTTTDWEPLLDWRAKIGTDIDYREGGTLVVR